MLEDLTPDQRALADFMSTVSEDAFCAGWVKDLEYALWRAMVETPFVYGLMRLNEGHTSELRKLSAACGGWIRFDEEHEEVFEPITIWESKFIRYLEYPPGQTKHSSQASDLNIP